ncbi:MAG: hypothetical protein RMY34_14975 [Aulosira sp. DedQUE10]|nr:hypothetical protein [Aulosira sp. DedQUE10]
MITAGQNYLLFVGVSSRELARTVILTKLRQSGGGVPPLKGTAVCSEETSAQRHMLSDAGRQERSGSTLRFVLSHWSLVRIFSLFILRNIISFISTD